MIKFFRRIRQQLVSQNKFSKYMLYAIGEIVLVVLGILIALSINNWNESKKANINFNKSLVNVFNDLEIDLKRAEGVIAILNKKLIIADSVINGKYSASDYREKPNSLNLINGFPDFFITDMGFKTLMQKSENIPDKYEQLINDLNSQYIATKELLGSSLVSLSKIQIERRLRYTVNFPWYSQNDSVSIEKRIQYYVNNPIYKNEVNNYRVSALGNYFSVISLFYGQGFKLYLTIKGIINDTSPLPGSFPKNADDYDIYKFDYLGKYSYRDVDIFFKENNGFIFLHYGSRVVLLTLLTKDKFRNHNSGRTITFIRDESNKVISFNNGIDTANKVEIND